MKATRNLGIGLASVVLSFLLGWKLTPMGDPVPSGSLSGEPWITYSLDSRGKGADGTRRISGSFEGGPSFLVPWEEAGVVRRCQPSPSPLTWSCQDLLNLPGAEEAIGFWDVSGRLIGLAGSDADIGGRARLVGFTRSPTDLTAQMAALVFSERTEGAWLTAEPLVDERGHWRAILVGGRFQDFGLGWLRNPWDPGGRTQGLFEIWKGAGWIMDIRLLGRWGEQGRLLLSQRTGPMSGVWILELSPDPVRQIRVGSARRLRSGARIPMMLDVLEKSSERWLAVAEKLGGVWVARLDLESGAVLEAYDLWRPQGTGSPKAVRWGDLNGDGSFDLVVSCEDAFGERVGVYWWKRPASGGSPWIPLNISGSVGKKFDRMELVDLDHDGALDVLVTEETRLGLVGYLNPRSRQLEGKDPSNVARTED